jgi:hypothetical protein
MAPKTEARLSAVIAALSCLYVTWTGYVFAHRASAFQALFTGVGAELPPATKIVLAVCRPSCVWPVAIALVALLIAKEIMLRSVGVRVVVSVVAFMATAVVAAVVTEALFQPLFHLIEQVR